MHTQARILTVAAFLALALGQAQVAAQQASPDKPSSTHTGKLKGKVTDHSGKAAEGVTVVLTDSGTRESASAKTDRKGKYLFRDLFPGSYSLRAEKENLKSDSVPVTIANAKTRTANLKLSSQ
jgi:hypothetical protein